jgi:hypothetical protein
MNFENTLQRRARLTQQLNERYQPEPPATIDSVKAAIEAAQSALKALEEKAPDATEEAAQEATETPLNHSGIRADSAAQSEVQHQAPAALFSAEIRRQSERHRL